MAYSYLWKPTKAYLYYSLACLSDAECNQMAQGDCSVWLPVGNVDGVMVPRRKTRVVPPPAVCPLTTCMRILGGAWTPNVLWYLREEPRRFSELKADLQGISAKTLSARLRKLERD